MELDRIYYRHAYNFLNSTSSSWKERNKEKNKSLVRWYQPVPFLDDNWSRIWQWSCTVLGCAVGPTTRGWTPRPLSRRPFLPVWFETARMLEIFFGGSRRGALDHSCTKCSYWLCRLVEALLQSCSALMLSPICSSDCPGERLNLLADLWLCDIPEDYQIFWAL